MQHFHAELKIIRGNPFVYVPDKVLQRIFRSAKKSKGPIPIRGRINGTEYQQTLVRFAGDWRLYINMKMLQNSPRRIGELIRIEVEFDGSDRSIKLHPKLARALAENPKAKTNFEALSPSRQNEIKRYIANLKTEKSLERNVARAIDFLSGKGRFVGRENPMK